MDLNEILEHLRTKGKKPTFAPEPGPRGLRPSVSPRVGTVAAPTVVPPEEAQPNDPRFRLRTPSPISDYYRDPLGTGPMGDYARHEDIVALIREAEKAQDWEKVFELKEMLPSTRMEEKPRLSDAFPRVMDPQAYRESRPELGLEKGIPVDEMGNLAPEPWKPQDLDNWIKRTFGKPTIEYQAAREISRPTEQIPVDMLRRLAQKIPGWPESQKEEGNLFESIGEDIVSKVDDYKIVREQGEKASEAYSNAIKDGLSPSEAHIKFKEQYPNIPDWYWTAVSIAVEAATIPLGGAIRTGVRATAASVPSILRPFFRLFGEAAGLPNSIENTITSGVIKSFLGTTGYGIAALRMLKEGEGWTAAFSPDEQALYRQRMAQPSFKDALTTRNTPIDPTTTDAPPTTIATQTTEVADEAADEAAEIVEDVVTAPEPQAADFVQGKTQQQAEELLTTREGIESEIKRIKTQFIDKLKKQRRRERKKRRRKEIDDEIAYREQQIEELRARQDELPEEVRPDIPVGTTEDLFKTTGPDPYYVVPSLRATREDVIETLNEMGIPEEDVIRLMDDPNYDPMTQPGVPEQLRIHQENKPYTYVDENGIVKTSEKLNMLDSNAVDAEVNRLLNEMIENTPPFSPDAEALRLLRNRIINPDNVPSIDGAALRAQAIRNVEEMKLQQRTETPPTTGTAPRTTAAEETTPPTTETGQQVFGPRADPNWYGEGVIDSFSQRMIDDVHDKITGAVKFVPRTAGKLFDSAIRGVTRAADITTAKTIGRQPNFRRRYETFKTKWLRIDGGFKKSLSDRYEYVRAISQRVYRNIQATPAVRAMARNLENQLALMQNYKGQVQGTWNALLRDLNRNAPDLDFNDVEEYAYLHAAKDAIIFRGDGKVSINIARQGEEPKIISTRKEANAAINEFKNKYSTTQRTIVEGTGGQGTRYVNVRDQLDIARKIMAKHSQDMRENMVASGRLSEGYAARMAQNSPNLNILYNVEDGSIGKFVPLASRDNAMEHYQQLLAASFIKNTNNNIFQLIIDVARKDFDPNGLSKRIKQSAKGNPNTYTFLRNGVEETWSVPKELNEIWGAANQFGFDAKEMRGVIALSNVMRASTTVFNPRFLLRALPADLYNYMAYEERNPLAALGRIGILGSSRIAYALGKQDTIYERVRDALMMAGGSQEKTRAFEMAGFAPSKTRTAQAGKPVSIENDEQLNKLFSPKELKKTADEMGYHVSTNEKEATSFAESSMGVIGLKVLKSPFTGIQAAARKQEFAARLLTMYKVLDDELGGTMIGGIPSVKPAWMTKYSSMQLARTQAGQEAAARAVDVTLNFDRGGTAIKQMNTYIPFLNSTFEGAKHPWRRLFYGPTRVTTALNLSYLMAADTAVTAHNMSYPEYYDVDAKIRYGSLFWITGYKMDADGNYIEDENGKRQLNVTVFIPKFWNWGGVLAVRTIMHEMLHQNDPSQQANAEYVEKTTGDLPTWLQRTGQALSEEALPEFARQQAPIQIRGENLTDTVLNIYQVPGLRAALSQVFNRNYYFGSDVVPEALQGRPKEEQYLAGTPRPYVEAGKLINQSPLRIQQMVNDLFGGGAEVPVDIFDKIIDMFSPPYTEENLQDFTQWATASRSERGTLESSKPSEWRYLMERMSRDPDLEQFDVAGLAQQEDEGFLERLGNLAGTAVTPFQDVFRPTDTGKAAFVKGIELVEKQTPFSFDDSKAVDDLMGEFDNYLLEEKLEIERQLNRGQITHKTHGEQLKEIGKKRRDELERLDKSGRYPKAVQFSENTEQGVSDRTKYYSLLAGEGILPDTRERGEAIYRSIHDVAIEIEYLGVDELIENPNYGKRLKEIEEKVAALSPSDRALYREYELSKLDTDAERERRIDLIKIAESGYWDAGVPEFEAMFSRKYPRRIEQIKKWLGASSELKYDLTTKANIPDEDKKFYGILERAYNNSSQRRKARSAILAKDPEILELLLKHGYKRDKIPPREVDEIEGYQRRLVPTLRT